MYVQYTPFCTFCTDGRGVGTFRYIHREKGVVLRDGGREVQGVDWQGVGVRGER